MSAKFVMEPRISSDEVGKAFGAKAYGKRAERPIDILEVRETLQTMVRSSGGRPGLASSKGQSKIPRIASDWERVEKLSQVLHVPAGQVAATVLHLGLAQMKDSDIRGAVVAMRADKNAKQKGRPRKATPAVASARRASANTPGRSGGKPVRESGELYPLNLHPGRMRRKTLDLRVSLEAPRDAQVARQFLRQCRRSLGIAW